MKSDYQCLIELWKIEVIIREKRAQLVAWKESIERRKKDCLAQQKEINDIAEKLGQLEEELRDLDQYFQKTERSIERLKLSISGHAMDRYELVLQQIAQLEVTRDERELEYLEKLESQEQKKHRQGIVQLQLEAQKRRIRFEAERWRTDGEKLKQDIRRFKEEQEQIFPMMNDRVVGRYKRLAQDHPQVLAKIRNGACAHCDVLVPLMIRADVNDRELVRSCGSCQAFLISVYEDCS